MANGADGSLVIDTELDNDGFKQGSDKLLSAVNKLAQQIDNLGTGMKESFSGITSILQNLSAAAQQSTSGVGAQATQAAQAAQQIGQAQSQAAASTGRAAQAASAYDKQLAKLEKQIETARGKLAEYYQEIEEIHASTDETLTHAVTDEQTVHVLEIEQLQIEAVNQKYAAKIAVLEQLEAEYAKVAAARDAANQPQSEGNKDTDGTTQSADGLRRVAHAEQEASQSSEQLSGALGGVDQELQKKPGDAGAASSSFFDLRTIMSNVGSAAVSMAKRFAQIGFKAVTTGVKRAISGLKSFATQAKKTSLTSNGLVRSLTSLKRLLITRVKRMFISAVFNNVKEGIQRLAQFSSAFNATMSEMKNSASQLGGDIAVSISNIIAALEPVILRIIALLSTAISYLNQFFALLRGKSTYMRAKKGAEDYAKAAGAAGGAQKEWNNELYGYDELTRQSDQSGGGGGGGDTGIEYEEAPIELPQGVQDWIKRLKEAWKNADWYGVGRTVAEGLNTVVDKVDDWILNKLQPSAIKWAGRVAEILNGFIENTNWKKIGKTVADGFNTIIRAIRKFLKKLNARSIGSAVGKTIRGWFENIDFDAMADIVISMFNGVADAVRGFLDEEPFEGLAEKIYNAINRVLYEVDWAELGRNLFELFTEVLGVFIDVIKHIDWHQVGVAIGEFLGSIDWWGVFTQVADFIWTVFSEVMWGVLTGALDGLFNSEHGTAFLAFVAAILGLKLAFALAKPHILSAASSLMTSIGDAVSSGLSSLASTISAHAPAIAKAAGIVFDAVMVAYDTKTLVETAKGYEAAQDAHAHQTETYLNSYAKLYEEKGKEVADQWAMMVEQIDTTGMSFEEAQQALVDRVEHEWDGVPQNMWEGFAAGWDHYFGNDGAGLGSLLGDAFTGAVDGIKDLLGIHSPSTVFEGIGINLVDGLKNGIGSAWSGLWSKVSGLVNGLISGVKSMFGVASPSKVFSEIGGYLDAGLAQGMEDGKRGLLSTASNIANAVTDGMTPDSPRVEMVADDVIGGMQAVISGLGSIAVTFKTIADTLASIGGFTMPQIAAGTVVPYRTRVDTTTPGTNDSEGDTGYLMSILSELQALVELVRGANNGNSDIKIMIDGREVFNVVVAENNRAIQRTGASPIRV